MKQQIKSLLNAFSFGVVLTFLTSSVFAEAQAAADSSGAAGAGSSAMAQGLLLGVFAVAFYFFILRPQNKRAKEHQQLVTNLQKGDEVITTGGLLGRVTRVADNFLLVAIAEGVEVHVQRQAIATTVPKGTLKSN